MIDVQKMHASICRDGWARIPDVNSDDALLELARLIGKPIACPTGEIVKKLVPAESCDAKPGTMSAEHGVGRFPMHTDMAVWTRPPRYIVLRVDGDTRRSTPVLRIERLIEYWNAWFKGFNDRYAEHAIWLVQAEPTCRYTTFSFKYDGIRGHRYDPLRMSPLNIGAREIQSRLEVLEWRRNNLESAKNPNATKDPANAQIHTVMEQWIASRKAEGLPSISEGDLEPNPMLQMMQMLQMMSDTSNVDSMAKLDSEDELCKDAIDWSTGDAAVIDNWKVLHGRDVNPDDEEKRTLTRIYVR